MDLRGSNTMNEEQKEVRLILCILSERLSHAGEKRGTSSSL